MSDNSNTRNRSTTVSFAAASKTMEETNEVREEGEEEANPNDTANPSISPRGVSLRHLGSDNPSALPLKATGRRKKSSLSAKQRKVAEERLGFLNKSFRPVPFSPRETLDFSAHEQLFQTLGLWDFAHLELDEDVRPDLLFDLIAYYDFSNHRSYVNNTRISVTRVDLARALGLPAKKEKPDALQGMDWMQELGSADGAIAALLCFMFNYILFEDIFMLPSEINQAIKFVKEGAPYKVDWASIMWVLVEKELKDGHKSGTFFYASHLQRLIKHQRPHLFSKKPEQEEEEQEEEVSVADEAIKIVEDDVNAGEEGHLTEEEGDSGIRKMRSLQDFVNVASDRRGSEFGLMLGDTVMDDFEDCKVSAECKWHQEGKSEGFEQCLMPCNSKASDNIDFENLSKIDEEENLEERFADGVSVEFSNFERLNSSDHLQKLNNVGIPCDAHMNSHNASSGVLLAMRSDPYKDTILDSCAGASTFFGYNGKRQVDELGDDDRDQFGHKCPQKRMRACEQWGSLPLSFDDCIYQIQGAAKRANALHTEKEQVVAKLEEQMQYLNHLVHDKEVAIQSLKMMLEGQQNWQMAVRHYEHELCLVTQLMHGYKKASKEIRVRFADYRKQHPHDDEPVYIDVPGTGGLVLSVREFEKERLVKEEEKRQELLGAFSNLDQILNKFEKCEECIMKHDSKLGKLVGDMERLKGGFVKSSSLDA